MKFIDRLKRSRARYDVFISYKSEDVNLARLVADQLIASDIKVWFAEYQVLLQNYSEFQQAIDSGIHNSAYGIAFTNNRYSKSMYCCDEMKELLKKGASQVIEVKMQEEDEIHRKFLDLEHSPQMVFKGQIEPILSLISNKTGWQIDAPKEIDEPSSHRPFQGLYMGNHYRVDIGGWNLTERGEEAIEGGNVMGPKFELSDSTVRTFGNIVMGPELSRAAIRYTSDDREMYKELMRYAPRHLERLGAKLYGLHLFFHKGLSQMALTYRFKGFWTRKYSVILQRPLDKKAVEFVFTFGCGGSFQDYCRQVFRMDRLVGSLDWTYTQTTREAIVHSQQSQINNRRHLTSFNEGWRLYKQGRYEEAIQCFNKTLEINPQYTDAWINKGASLSNLGRYEEALQCFNKALEINPQHVLAWNDKASLLINLNRYHEALECCNKILEINPKDADAWNNKGISFFNLGRLNQALECCNKALEFDPKQRLALVTKGASLSNLGRYEEALQCYNKALEINPENAQTWFNKGVSLYSLRRYNEAIECYNKALRIDPKAALTWYNKGLAEEKLSLKGDAAASYRRLVELASPRDAKYVEYARKKLPELEAENLITPPRIEETKQDYTTLKSKQQDAEVLKRKETSFKMSEDTVMRAPPQLKEEDITENWLKRGLSSAENGDLETFGLNMEILLYLKPSRQEEIQEYKETILSDYQIQPRDINLLNKLAREYTIPSQIRNYVLSKVEEVRESPGQQSNQVVQKRITELKSDNENVRLAATEALAKLGDRSAVPALIEALGRDKDPRMQRHAAEALGKLGDKSAVPALIEALKGGSSARKYAGGPWLEVRNDEVEVFKDLRSSVQYKAAEALGKLSDRSAVPALKEVSIKSTDRWLQMYVAVALAKLGSESATHALMKALEDLQDPDLRMVAGQQLGELGDRSAVPALTKAVKEGLDPLAALEALGRLRDRSAVPALIEAFKGSEWGQLVQTQAADALGRIGDRAALPALIEALKHDSLLIRNSAAEALAKLGDRSAVPALIASLKKGLDTFLAAEALGRLGDQSAVPALIDALRHDNVNMRKNAAEALGRLGDKSAVSVLRQALKFDDIYVRKSAAEALGALGDTSAVPALIEALKEDDDDLRGCAAKALSKLSDKHVTVEFLDATASFPKPEYAIVGLRWLCSKPDPAKLSQIKDELKVQSGYEMNRNGLELTARGECWKGMQYFKEAMNIDPDWEEARKALEDQLWERVKEGVSLTDNGRLDEGIAIFNRALEINPDNVRVHHNLGRAYSIKGLRDQAIAEYKRVIEMEPANADAHVDLGADYYLKDMTDQAIAEYKIALKLNPDHALAHTNLGAAYVNKGLLDRAMMEHKKALELNPNSAYANFNLASLYFGSRQYDLAWKHLRLAEKLGMSTQHVNWLINQLRRVSSER
jgi:tetratricopeptide (TPR) repeat protein